MTLDVIQAKGQHRIGFEAFGVPISVEVGSEELLTRVRAILPPGWRPCDRVPKEHRFTLRRRGGAIYRLEHPGESLAGGSDVDVALEVLDAELRAFTAMNAPEHIFVHAGVVALGDLAIVMPGPTFSGKTTLVTELIRAGALYYSDDLAAFDRDGLVHASPKPLSIPTYG